MALHLCHPYIWEDPRFIFKSFMYDGSCMSELVNRVFLVYMVCIVVGIVLESFSSGMLLLTGMAATLFLIPTFIKMSKYETDASGSKTEGFDTEESPHEPITSIRNPFQNVMIDDYKYAPTRAAAPDITSSDAKVNLDSMFRTQWYSDPTDVFGKSQSQRMFVTQPNTTIPNDQNSYQNWLYKIPGKTCKEGNYDACYGGTSGAVIPWLDSV